MVLEVTAELLYRPEDPHLRFLPEGPVDLGDGKFSWVAIQHAADIEQGSLCIFDLRSGLNQRLELPGRPGFAIPSDQPHEFIVGLERELGRFDTQRQRWEPFCHHIDQAVEGTIINDGEAFAEGIVFGTKDLAFQDPKAGLYLYRWSDHRLIQLRDDQTCSNGKIIRRTSDGWELLDIDTPTKRVVSYALDVAGGHLGHSETVVDLSDDEAFPDGMTLAADGGGVIVAMYDPRDLPHGVAREYALDDGSVRTVWRTPGSPRVTCPQWISWQGRQRLVLTTAIEHMTLEQQSLHPNAGALFLA